MRIGRLPKRVWSILVDTAAWAEWNPFARATGRLAVGERLTVEIRPYNKSPAAFRPTVVELGPAGSTAMNQPLKARAEST
jgi:hypothetical protein